MLIRTGACALLLSLASCTNLRDPQQTAVDDFSAGAGGDGADSGAVGGAAASGMSGQTGGSSGMSAGSGGVSGSSGGSGGLGGSGGTGGDQSSDASLDEDGDTGEMDGSDGDDAAVVDAEGPIQGRVIDYFENPVPNAQVTLDGTTVMTDDDGEFSFGPTPRTYSIGVALEVARFGAAEQGGYLFVGLTRRDPTLQMYRGLPKRSTNVTRNVTGVTFPLPSTEVIAMDLAGQHGGFSAPITSAGVTGSGEWEGPEEAQGHVHAIHYVKAASSPQLPTSYLAHASQPVAFDTDMATSFTLDLSSSGALASGNVSGTASGGSVGSRANEVFVRFADDAAVTVLSHGSPNDAFTYLVPSIAGASIAVAAMRNNISWPPFAVAYAEGIAPGASDIALEIPVPATLLSPATAESDVDGETVFSWSGPDQVYMFVAKGLNVAETFYVITAAKTARLPIGQVTLPALRSNFVYEWSVRTHRTFATVDEAAGPTGYLDSYCYGRLRGPRRDSSTHTGSNLHSFTTAP